MSAKSLDNYQNQDYREAHKAIKGGPLSWVGSDPKLVVLDADLSAFGIRSGLFPVGGECGDAAAIFRIGPFPDKGRYLSL